MNQRNTIAQFIFLFVCIASPTLLSAGATNEVPVDEAARKISKASKDILGLPVQSLRWLVDASPKSVLLYRAVADKGQIPYIKLLEDAGYVEMRIIEGKERYLILVPTERGQRFQDALRKAEQQ